MRPLTLAFGTNRNERVEKVLSVGLTDPLLERATSSAFSLAPLPPSQRDHLGVLGFWARGPAAPWFGRIRAPPPRSGSAAPAQYVRPRSGLARPGLEGCAELGRSDLLAHILLSLSDETARNRYLAAGRPCVLAHAILTCLMSFAKWPKVSRRIARAHSGWLYAVWNLRSGGHGADR